jgi:hypothetical protein
MLSVCSTYFGITLAMAEPAPIPLTPNAAPSDRRRDKDMALLIAWLASLAVHVVLFSAMVAIPWIHHTIGRAEAPPVATTDIRDLPKQTKFTMAPTKSPFADAQEELTRPTHIAPEQRDTLSELRQVTKPELSIVGIGTGGDEFSKYGLRVGSGSGGPQFFGLGGEARAARKIVYVVDRSGSMLGVFSDLRTELKRSIDGLRKSQKYHVIFYSTDPPMEAPPSRLVNAIRASKERTFKFIDETMPEGMTQPILAMKRAFALEPDLIYFLSDGDIPEAEPLKDNLKIWNRKKQVRVFTIAYVSSAGRSLLEEIAREHNGAFRFVSEYDLEK